MTYAAEERGVPVHDLPALQRELSPLRDAEAIRRLRAILRDRRPDVLHTHTAKAGATGRLAALAAGVRAARGWPRAGPAESPAYLPLAWLLATSGALAGTAFFGGTPLATLFWLSIGVAAAVPTLLERVKESG